MIPINKQPAEKRSSSKFLEVHSVFYTIQGEGPFCGQPAVFVRLAGCNLQCPGCDTEYTKTRMPMLEHEVAAEVWKAHTYVRSRLRPLVVITGGEPFRQNIMPLLKLLTFKGYRVQIETNGTLTPYVFDGLDHEQITVVCSPKTGKVSPQLLPYIHAYKYVLHADSVDPDDGLPTLALGHSAAPRVARPPAGFRGPVYLQPMDTQNPWSDAQHRQACIDSCMKYGYTLQLQIHKILNLE